jgi:ribosomal protein S18 acetylase RimI-like enzyme
MTFFMRDSKYEQVAKIHIAALASGFLPSLGVRFLTALYSAMDSSDDCCLIICEREGRIVGFIAGARTAGAVYKALLRRRPHFFLYLLPSMFSVDRIRRTLELLKYVTKRPVGEHRQTPSAELLVVAVCEGARSKGVGEELYRRLTNQFANMGIHSFKIVVGESLTRAHLFYERMGAQKVGWEVVHGGARSVVYVHNNTRASPNVRT